MTSPHNVLTFGRRRSYQEAVREQRDCQQEALTDGLKRIKAWLDNGIDPVEACAREANRSRALIIKEAKTLKEYTTPVAAAVFLRRLASELEDRP